MTRTCDLLVRSQTLYPTELRARAVRLFELSTAARYLPIWQGIRQLFPTGTCSGATLMVRHAGAGIAADPARIDSIRHPHTGETARRDLRAEELLHRFRMRAAGEELPRILSVLPGADGHQPGSYRYAHPAQKAIHRHHLADDRSGVLLDDPSFLGRAALEYGNAEGARLDVLAAKSSRGVSERERS